MILSLRSWSLVKNPISHCCHFFLPFHRLFIIIPVPPDKRKIYRSYYDNCVENSTFFPTKVKWFYVYESKSISRTLRYTPNFISSGSKIVKRLRRRQYDPLIIAKTIGLVLGPCTALCRLFLKHCTLTNKAVGTIWRALSKPPQRRQGPDLRPLWLLVGTPSAIRPELAFSRAEHSLPYSDVTIYIFAILYLSFMPYG